MRNHYVTVGEGIEGYLYCRECEKGDRIIAESSPPKSTWVANPDGTYCEVGKTQEQVNEDCRSYLLHTDWYIIRSLERGIPVPEEVTLARLDAANSVVD